MPKASKIKLHLLQKACRTEYLRTPNIKWLPILPMTGRLKIIVIPSRRSQCPRYSSIDQETHRPGPQFKANRRLKPHSVP